MRPRGESNIPEDNSVSTPEETTPNTSQTTQHQESTRYDERSYGIHEYWRQQNRQIGERNENYRESDSRNRSKQDSKNDHRQTHPHREKGRYNLRSSTYLKSLSHNSI